MTEWQLLWRNEIRQRHEVSTQPFSSSIAACDKGKVHTASAILRIRPHQISIESTHY